MAALTLLQIPRDEGSLYKYANPLIESWTAVPNKGVALLQTQVNDPSNYAGDFANLDTLGSPNRRALRAVAGANTLTIDSNGIALSSLSIGGALNVTGNTTLSTLQTSGAATLNSLAVTTSATVGTTLGVTGASTLAGVTCTTLHATGAATLDSTLAAGATTVTTLHATGAATFDTTAAIGTSATVGTTLSVSGQISGLATPISIATSGLITIGTSLNVTTSAVIGTTLSVSGQISGLATPTSIATSGAISSGTSVAATTTMSVGTTLTVTGAATLVSTLTVGNATGVASGTIRLPNNGFIYSEETGGTDRALIGIDASNFLRVGDYVSGTAIATVGATTDLYLVAGNAAGNIVLQIQPAKFGLFGSAPNAKQTITGVTTGTLAQLQTVVRNMLAAWANHGAWTDSTT